MGKFLKQKVPRWRSLLILGLVIAISLGFYTYGRIRASQQSEPSQTSYTSVTSLEKVNQVAFLNVGIQKIVTSKETTKVLFTDLDIPFSEKEAVIILNYQAKFGIKKGVRVDEKEDSHYTVSIPKFEVIGFELAEEHPYQLYNTSGGLLSYSTKDIDTGKLVTDSLSNKEQEEYLKRYQSLVKDSAKEYYQQIITSIDKKAKVTFVFQK
ncbi:DUF4230 domain-containing protein [Streptococcus dentasini]